MVDMAPVTSAPQPTQLDLAPGPVMQQADASPPEAAKQEEVRGTDRADPAAAKAGGRGAARAEAEPTPQKPEPAKIVPEQKPTPVEAKGRSAPKRRSRPKRRRRRAPRRTACRASGAGRLRHQFRRDGGGGCVLQAAGRRASAALQAISAAAKAAGQQGTARCELHAGPQRPGAVSRPGGSSGHSALDAETLAMVRRAQPFPAFPPEIKQSSMSVQRAGAIRPLDPFA